MFRNIRWAIFKLIFHSFHLNGLHTWLIYYYFFLSTDGLAEQNPAPQIALNYEDILNNQLIGTLLLPKEHQDSYQSLYPPLYSYTTAINTDFQSTIPACEAVDCSIKESADDEKPLLISRTSPFSLTDLFEKTLPSQLSQGTQTSRIPEYFMEETLIQMKAFKKTNDDSAVSTPPAPAATVTREERFSILPSNTPVRTTKIDAHIQMAGQAQSTVPAVCTDATISDRLWSKLKPSTQQDSMSSSSSISSSDTIIDLSLPSPVRKCFKSFSTVSNSCDPTQINCSCSPSNSRHSVPVNKRNSQPNLWQSQCYKDEFTPCPMLHPQEMSVDSPSKRIQRRHTWSRLYMEELKQSSANRFPSAATSPDSMSKSLADLTSDDISCHFDSTYRSISSSFVSRPIREQHPNPQDFAIKCRAKESEEEEEAMNGSVVQRTSRSQSRVRYIANRAKKNQERQRIQGIIHGTSASFSFTTYAGSSSRSDPIEVQGNPEGACSIARNSEDLLEQLNLLARQSPTLSRLPTDPDNTEVFFLLRLWDDKTVPF